MLHNIAIDLKFKQPYDSKPKIRLISPPSSTVKNITTTGFTIVTRVNIHTTHVLPISYSANAKELVQAKLNIQTCPACGLFTNEWIITQPMGLDKRTGKPAPSPLSFICPQCGNMFVPHNVVEAVKRQLKSNIILSGT